MITTYAARWSRTRRSVNTPLDEAAASKLHEKGKLYTVISGDADRPFAFIEVRLEVAYLGVSFLDDLRRVLTTFQFSPRGLDGQAAPAGMCFLKSIVRREFDDETDKAAFGTSYDYFFDGRCEIIHEDLRTGERLEGRHVFDVSAHWEALPAFGQYDAFLQYDRWKHGDVKH